MTAINIFNTTLNNFINELGKVLPNEKSIHIYKSKFKLIKMASARKPMETYIFSVKPYEYELMKRDEQFFILKADIKMLKDLHIKKHWAENKFTEENKKIIWEYLQSLYILGSIITHNVNILPQIDEVVELCKKELNKENPTTRDIVKTACETVGKKISM